MAASRTPSMGSAARAAAAARSEHEDRIQSLYADVCKVGMLDSQGIHMSARLLSSFHSKTVSRAFMQASAGWGSLEMHSATCQYTRV